MPRLSTLLATLLSAALGASAMAQDVLGGDQGLACQAILCLATGSPPAQCAPALSRFYGISYMYWADTLQGRINFLNLCPVAAMTPAMRSLTQAMANGAGRCDADALNATLLFSYSSNVGRNPQEHSYIDNHAPDYCTAYTSHPYTDLHSLQPLYVGDPLRGGHWASPANYSQELAAYQARIAAEDQAARQASGD